MSRSRRISIVMPCFNHGEFLREAVDSVLSANRDDLELVMVDDGSTDERTRKEMEHLRARGIKVIWQENKGPAAARNAGIAASQADYILPLDADDRLRAEWIDRGLEILDTDSTVGVVCGDTKFFGKKTDLWLGGPFDLNRLLQQSYIPCTALYRRSVWEQNGGYDSTIVGYEDWEFWLGAVEHGWKFAYIPEIFFDYRKAGESMLSRARVHVKETADFVAKKHGKLYREAWLQALGEHDSLLLRHESVRWTSRNLGRLLTAQVKRRLPLVRNIVLALVATFIIVEAGRNASPSAFALLGAITTSGRLILAIDLLLLALILIQAWFTLHLVRQNGRLITRLEAVEAPLGIDGRALVDEHAGLYVGTKAPDFALRSLDGGAVMTLSALCGHELPVLLIFGDPDCGPCAQLMPEIVNWQRNYSDKITIALLATGSEEANRAKNAEHGLRNILLEGDSNISESYQVNGTPAAMVVGKDGRVAGRLVLGPGRIRPLFERTVGLAPAIQLPVQGPTTPVHNEPRPLTQGPRFAQSDFRGQGQRGLGGKSLLIMTPMYGGQCTMNFLFSVLKLIDTCRRFDIPIEYKFLGNEGLVTRARNRLVDHWMKNSNATHGVFILNLEDGNGQKTFNVGEPQLAHSVGSGLMMIARRVPKKLEEYYPDNWYEGTRTDPAALAGKIFDHFQAGINPESKDYDSEDYRFCINARRAGFKIWVLPWARTTHAGTHMFVGDLPMIRSLMPESEA